MQTTICDYCAKRLIKNDDYFLVTIQKVSDIYVSVHDFCTFGCAGEYFSKKMEKKEAKY